MVFTKLIAFTALAVSISSVQAALIRRVTCPDGSTTANEACCPFFPLRDHLQSNIFNNECGQDVREALRMTFHDGVGFSPTLGGGGADGSLIYNSTIELAQNGNTDAGLSDAVDIFSPLVGQFNVTGGDLIYFASAVGLSNCVGAPQLQFFAGRPVATGPAPDGSVSQPTDSVDTILQRFSEVGFSPDELVALLASHSLAAADAFANGMPLDSTPAIFDSQIFVETQLKAPIPGEARIPSDAALARDNRTSCTWQSFVEDQTDMASKFAAAMLKLSLVAQDQSKMTDCSDVVPAAKPPNGVAPYFPGSSTVSDVQAACSATPFPTLTQNAAIASLTPVLEHTLQQAS